ncbi:Nose resistant to fluoxetine protein 6 [Aphelenchoides besseyi]|nr:Nose resistant to fluoxetine protein 6 [Aphelenchoides besseyi]KAI6201192.1 Nose resistant to fluoxetine protein 6 [Aphelenchoides besseyi]
MTKTKIFVLPLVVFSLLLNFAGGCLLCPYRIPPMPKPLDQIQLPSAEKIVEMSNGLVQLCENKTRLLSVRNQCRNEVTKLVCSFNEFTRSYQNECPASEDPSACAKCRTNKAAKYAATSWIQIWVDSFGKMPSGISEGNYHWLGDYEQCQMLKNSGVFNGRYCLVDFAIPSSTSNLICDHNNALEVSLGACLPADCSSEESTLLVQHVTQHSVHIRCETQGQWSLSAIIFVILILIWLAALWIATFVHWWTNPKDLGPLTTELVFALSLQRNANDCMRTKRIEEHNFRAAPGLQVLSMILLVSGYVFYIMMPYLENPTFAYELSQSFMYQPLMNFSFYVDGFLALGAMRLALKPAAKFSTIGGVITQLLRRFSRTWPAYAVVTLFLTTAYNRLGEGPMWSHNDLSRRCVNSWWANILFVNNLLGGDMTCLDTGFLVVLEAQLFILGCLMLFLVHQNRRIAVGMTVGLCSISIIYVFVVTYKYELFATLIPTKNVENLEAYGIYLNKIYINPISRMAPYFIGLLLSFSLTHQFPKSLTRAFNITISLFCAVVLMFVVWAPYYLWSERVQFWHSLYAALHRCAWGGIVLFIAYSLNNASHKNLRNTILSWRVFYPLSKLTYLVFLISEPVSQSIFASLHRPIYLTSGSMLLTCAGCVILSYMVAFLIDVCISRPFRHLLDLCVNKF